MVRPADLLMLLQVARYGSFAAAGAAAGVEHTTVSRRIAALERDLGAAVVIRAAGGATLTDLGRAVLDGAERVERAVESVDELAAAPARATAALSGLVRIAAPEGFGSQIVAPVIARLHREHPALRVELVLATRPLVQGVGSDIEIGVGEPASPRLESFELARYSLGLYATADYLQTAGKPLRTEDLATHALIYYVDSLLRVDDLDVLREIFPGRSPDIGSTSVYAQLAATAAGGGIGLLPHFLALSAPTLLRVLPSRVEVQLQFRVALAPRVLRRPAAVEVLRRVQQEVAARRDELLPGSSTHG
jgi:DNA-binding transcriptional LysR family regulator